MSSVTWTRNCISCVPNCLLHVYQLRPELSTPNMTICVTRLVRNCISCIESYGCTKVQQLWGSYTVLLYFILYTISCSHTELLNDIDKPVVISCCGLILITLLKKSFRGRRQVQRVPNIAHFRLLLWSDEHLVSGRSFNAVSLGVPSTWPPNCAHIILIHSAETPVWYFINILLFHVQKLFSWFSKYVW